MRPETILRAYTGTLLAAEQGLQGPIRRRRARQRHRFMAWLSAWSDRTVEHAEAIRRIEP